jgi:hypothetical protein
MYSPLLHLTVSNDFSQAMSDVHLDFALGESRLLISRLMLDHSRTTDSIEKSSRCIHYPTLGIINVVYCVTCLDSKNGPYDMGGVVWSPV